MTQQELHEAFVGFVNSGDEAGARKFLIEHLNDFPEDMKKDIAFAFFLDAVEKDSGNREFERSALDLMKELDKTEEILEEAQKVASLREEM